MNFNKILITKIDTITNLSKEFDDNFKKTINLQNNDITEDNVNQIYTVTKNYLLIRSNHGMLLLLMDKLKKSIENINDNEIDSQSINKLYELSTFTSILSNINDLVNNIDFEYKKFAIKFPKFINKKPLQILLFTKNDNDELINIINEAKKKCPENIYKIIKCSGNEKKIKCDNIIGIDANIKITKLPALYILNESNINEIETKQIKDVHNLLDLIN